MAAGVEFAGKLVEGDTVALERHEQVVDQVAGLVADVIVIVILAGHDHLACLLGKLLEQLVLDVGQQTSGVALLRRCVATSAFTGIFMSLDGDQLIATWISSVGIGKWGAFAIMMAIVFVMGMFLDWLGIVMIVFPIFLPIMDMFGFDRLWIVAVTAVMLQTCFMTPPFGFALFYIKGIVPPEVKIQEIYRGVIPFILIIIAVVVLVTIFPQVVYFLPNLVAS